MNERFRCDGVKNTPARASPPTGIFRVIHLFVGAEKTSASKKTKKSTHFRAFCVVSESALARGLATENASSVRGQTGGRTLEVSFAEATVDVKENIFDCVRVFVDVFCA